MSRSVPLYASTVCGVISQSLCKKKTGGRIAAYERGLADDEPGGRNIDTPVEINPSTW